MITRERVELLDERIVRCFVFALLLSVFNQSLYFINNLEQREKYSSSSNLGTLEPTINVRTSDLNDGYFDLFSFFESVHSTVQYFVNGKVCKINKFASRYVLLQAKATLLNIYKGR